MSGAVVAAGDQPSAPARAVRSWSKCRLTQILLVAATVDEPKRDPGRAGLHSPRRTYTSGRTENDT